MKTKTSYTILLISGFNNGFKSSKQYLYNTMGPFIRTKSSTTEFSYKFNKHKNKIVDLILNGKIPK